MSYIRLNSFKCLSFFVGSIIMRIALPAEGGGERKKASLDGQAQAEELSSSKRFKKF